MALARTLDPTLKRIARDLRALYGARLERLILFGSRARGEHHPDSDYDLLAVLVSPETREERDRCAYWTVDFMAETDLGLDVFTATAEHLHEPSLFMEGVRQDGVDVP